MSSNFLADSPLRILVTGAAGLIGREVCGALAGRGHAVAGLLRRKATAFGDPTEAVPGCGPLTAGTVTLFAGDVAEPGLGLATEMAACLAAQLDLVVHCAAVTGFNLPPETYHRVNEGGTSQLVGFAAGLRSIPLLHVSTAYVCGLAEGAVAEAPVGTARFNNGYEASKAAAEAIVLAAQRAGRIVAVARPSVVVGRWTDGATGTFGTIYQAIRLLAEGRIRVLPVCPGASLDLVPIDHVVGGLVDIAERMADANGRIFHLASGNPVPLTALLRLSEAFPQLQSPRFVPPEHFELAGLDQRARWLYDQVVGPCAAYLRASPRFVTANLPALSQRHCPPIDDAFLHRMTAYAVSAGFLQGERVSGCRDNAGRAPAAARSPN
jgi:nucleoside-diphosphate-sugar epimerase